MNIDQINTFLELAETGNFNRAAENLNVTQSTISSRIKALETKLGHTLLIREHSGCRLTPAGRQFLFYANNIQLFWQKSHQTVTLPSEFIGVLSVGAQVSLWEKLVLDWMTWMRSEAPNVALNVQADYSAAQMSKLSDGLLDLGVMYQPRHTAGLIIETLFDEELILVSTEDRELSLGWREDYVYVDWGEVFRNAHAAAFPNMETPAVSVELGALGLQYILKNGGSGYFPRRSVKHLLESDKLFHLEAAPTLYRPAYLVYQSDPIDKQVLDVAIDGLRTIAAR
ncbi:MAG: LysR family transcriptional regulator [Pseudomonadota bacterium]